MSKKVKIFVSCEEANHVCDKTQYHEASFWEKVKLNIHLLYCRACREYTQNNQKLTKVIKKSEVECLNSMVKDKMKAQFKTELEKHQF